MRLSSLSLIAALAAAALASAAPAQDGSDTKVRIETAPASGRASDDFQAYPRYYTDTKDVLVREAEDGTPRTPNPNGANGGITPGMSKNNYVTRTYPIYNTDAINIQAYLLRSVAYEGGIVEVMSGPDVTDSTGKKTQYLIATVPDFMVPGIDEMVKLADVKGFTSADGTTTLEYRGKHRTAGELKAILAGTELGNIGGFYYAPFADNALNTIYFSEAPADMPASKAALEMFDRPPLQAQFDIIIYEIDNDNLVDVGLDWDAWKRFVTGGFTYSSTGSPDQFFDSDIDSFDTLLTWDAAVLADFFNWLTKNGRATVATRARILSINSEDNPGALSDGAKGKATATPATFRSVRQIPYTVPVAPTGNTDSGRMTDAFDESVFEGIEIAVQPYIASESITAEFNTTVNSLVGFSRETKRPIISSRESRSMVNLTSGVPQLLGAFDKETMTTARLGIPFLKEIPVLKYLFSRETTANRGSKVVIFVKPTIINGAVPTTEPTLGAAETMLQRDTAK